MSLLICKQVLRSRVRLCACHRLLRPLGGLSSRHASSAPKHQLQTHIYQDPPEQPELVSLDMPPNIPLNATCCCSLLLGLENEPQCMC